MQEGFYLYKPSQYQSHLKERLSVEQQNNLLILANHGDKEAQDILFEHNLRLVADILNRYFPEKDFQEKEELFSVGAMGLWEAITKFDITMHAEFSTYAVPYISGRIRTYIRDNAIIKYPPSIKNLQKKIINVQKEYTITTGRNDLTIKEIANLLSEDVETISHIMSTLIPVQNLQDPILQSHQISKELTLEETIIDQDFVIDDHLLNDELKNQILPVLNKLTEAQRRYIYLRFGFDGVKRNRADVTKILGISRQRSAELEKKALKRVLKYLPTNIKKDYQYQKNKQKQ